MKLTIVGLKETINNLTMIGKQLEMTDEPMRQATMLVAGAAKRNAPVDTGRLRASITPGVRGESGQTVGVVGSNVAYAPFMELGAKPHFPPMSALETWARRHGMITYLVCKAIAEKGIKGRRYLQKAFDAHRFRVIALLNDYVRKVTSK